MIQIAFLRRKCIGCNACVEVAPDHWIMAGEDGKSYLRKSEKKGEYYLKKITELEYEENRKAAEACPVKIIKLKNRNHP
jgi:ferredoxin